MAESISERLAKLPSQPIGHIRWTLIDRGCLATWFFLTLRYLFSSSFHRSAFCVWDEPTTFWWLAIQIFREIFHFGLSTLNLVRVHRWAISWWSINSLLIATKHLDLLCYYFPINFLKRIKSAINHYFFRVSAIKIACRLSTCWEMCTSLWVGGEKEMDDVRRTKEWRKQNTAPTR